MPLFHKSTPPPPPPAPASPPNRSRSLFSRNRDTHDQYSNGSDSGRYDDEDYHNGSGRSGGFFSRRRSSSSSSSSGRRSSNLRNDPSIMSARQKVSDAEAYEREADRALGQARAAVREARDHVKMLEREALEDARRAKAKQAEAKTVSKSARSLGRHG